MAKKQDGVLQILEDSKKANFNLGTYLDIGVGSIFKPQNKNQGDFLKALQGKNYSLAFDLWTKFVEGSSFSKSSSGKALHGFLLFKKGFFNVGLSRLFNESRPQQIHSSVYNLWNNEIDPDHEAWNRFIYSGPYRWESIANKTGFFKIASKKPFNIYKDKKRMTYLLSLPLPKTVDTFMLEWRMALTTIKEDNMSVATQILKWLLDHSKPHRKNKVYLTIARLLNHIGEDEASLFYYEKVGKQIPFWLSAKEEQSWIYYKQGQYQEAFSSAVSLLHPNFENRLSPHGFLIVSMSQLKLCDYPGVLNTLNGFKNRFSVKYNSLQKTISDPSFVIQDLKNYHISQEKKILPHWPLYIEQNAFLKDQLLLLDFIEASDLKIPQAPNAIKREIAKNIREVKKNIGKEIQKIARREMSQIDQVLNWIHFVEVDSLYRIYGFHDLSQNSIFKTDQQTVVHFVKDKNLISFPYEKDEIWWDELGQYQVLNNHYCPRGSYVF